MVRLFGGSLVDVVATAMSRHHLVLYICNCIHPSTTTALPLVLNRVTLSCALRPRGARNADRGRNSEGQSPSLT